MTWFTGGAQQLALRAGLQHRADGVADASDLRHRVH